MAVDIPLFPIGRTELPPGRAGAAKPPLSLADRSAEIGLALAGAKFAGDMFNDLVETRAASEEATFHGAVNTFLEEYDTVIAANPGWGYDQVQKERDRMMANITKASQFATTRQGKENNANWLTRNKGLIHAKSQTSMEAIRAKQEIAAYRLRQEKNMTSFDATEYISDQENMIEAGLLNREIAMAQREVDLGVMAEAQKKVALGNAVGIGFEAWQVTVTPDDPDGNLNAGFEALDALPIPEGERPAVESKLKTRVKNRQAEIKSEALEAEAEAVEKINERLNKKQFAGLDDFIDSLSLSETEKIEQKKTANAYVKSVNDTKEDITTSDKTNIAIDQIINDVSNGRLTYDEAIRDYAELSKDINAKEGEQNLDDIRKAADAAGNPILNRPVVKDGMASLGRMRSAEIAALKGDLTLDDRQRLEAEARIENRTLAKIVEARKWAIENADRPDFNEKYRALISELNTPEVEKVVLSFFEKLRLPKDTAFFRRLPGKTEGEKLAEKRLESLEEDAPDLFRSLTDEEKTSVLERFRRGETVQDIIDRARRGE